MDECVQAGLSLPPDPARSSGAETPLTSASHSQSFAEPGASAVRPAQAQSRVRDESL